MQSKSNEDGTFWRLLFGLPFSVNFIDRYISSTALDSAFRLC